MSQLQHNEFHGEASESTAWTRATGVFRILGWIQFCSNPTCLTRCIFCLLGIGVLIPWNAFVSAAPYFVSRTCRKDAILWFGFVYNLSSVASLIWRISRRSTPTTSSRMESYYSSHPTALAYFMVMIPFFTYLLVFVLTIILVFVQISESWFFIIALASLATCGALGAHANAGLTLTASSTFLSSQHNSNPHHQSNNLGPLLAGYAVGGVVVSTANFFSAVGESPVWEQICPNHASDEEALQLAARQQLLESCVSLSSAHTIDWAVVFYFGMSCVVLIACLMGYQWLHSSSQRHYEPLADVAHAAEAQPSTFHDSVSPRLPTEMALELDLTTDVEDLDSDANFNSTLEVWTKIRQPALTIFLTFLVTLAIFPAWTSTLQSAHHCNSERNRLENDLFTPLTFLWFNVFDLVGRLLAERYSSLILMKNDLLIPYALSRCILFLLFAMLPSSFHSRRTMTPIPSDLLSFTVQAALASSNGFLVSWSFMVAPMCISKHPDEQIKSSEVLNLSLCLGLLAGSLLSFVYLSMV